ncbi:alanine racemase [Bacillota bacterium LX-D]|nr:alanine racemase [Bacillota bacterium LX-D]
MPWRNLVGNRWVEIDTDALRFNLAQVRKVVAPDVKILAVVKADAYGLGAVEAARVFAAEGVAMLGVTTVDEGIELREYGIKTPILVFSPFLPGEEELIIKYKLTAAVSSISQLDDLAGKAGSNQKVPVHIKVETGMGRTGILLENFQNFLERARGYKHIFIEGLFTHLAQASQGDSFTQKQNEKFQQAVKITKDMGLEIPCLHIANSAATIDLPELSYDMVRVGTLLYGQHPAQVKNKLELRDPWKIKARVIHVQKVPAGTSIGYGRDYITSKGGMIAVIPLGWADGLTVSPQVYPKNFLDFLKMTAKLYLNLIDKKRSLGIIIKGKKYPLVGRLGMQLSMANVDEKVALGDEVEVKMRRLSTNPRLPRVYFREGSAYLVRLTSGEWQIKKQAEVSNI